MIVDDIRALRTLIDALNDERETSPIYQAAEVALANLEAIAPELELIDRLLARRFDEAD